MTRPYTALGYAALYAMATGVVLIVLVAGSNLPLNDTAATVLIVGGFLLALLGWSLHNRWTRKMAAADEDSEFQIAAHVHLLRDQDMFLTIALQVNRKLITRQELQGALRAVADGLDEEPPYEPVVTV